VAVISWTASAGYDRTDPRTVDSAMLTTEGLECPSYFGFA
jgi:hypothetical protein